MGACDVMGFRDGDGGACPVAGGRCENFRECPYYLDRFVADLPECTVEAEEQLGAYGGKGA